ncbi:hypothetical protein PR048_014416 [Dryococelus australis]|uniref:Uncharacterized protein n=1 Tax=Dryococelus australis TaxID=614101 RepID=A0ABQ9HEB1_9NEOP|nr:hypothetical protein PR048_014416 [Dryococelus australis]
MKNDRAGGFGVMSSKMAVSSSPRPQPAACAPVLPIADWLSEVLGTGLLSYCLLTTYCERLRISRPVGYQALIGERLPNILLASDAILLARAAGVHGDGGHTHGCDLLCSLAGLGKMRRRASRRPISTRNKISPFRTCPHVAYASNARLPTKANRARSQIFAFGNRAGGCRWSARLLGDLPFPSSLRSGAALYSPHLTSPASALKTSKLTEAQISSLTHFLRDAYTTTMNRAYMFHVVLWYTRGHAKKNSDHGGFRTTIHSSTRSLEMGQVTQGRAIGEGMGHGLVKHSPGLISGNNGKPESGPLDRESNPGPPECEVYIPLTPASHTLAEWPHWSSTLRIVVCHSAPRNYLPGNSPADRESPKVLSSQSNLNFGKRCRMCMRAQQFAWHEGELIHKLCCTRQYELSCHRMNIALVAAHSLGTARDLRTSESKVHLRVRWDHGRLGAATIRNSSCPRVRDRGSPGSGVAPANQLASTRAPSSWTSGTWAARYEMAKRVCWRWPYDQGGEGDLDVLKNAKCSDPQ